VGCSHAYVQPARLQHEEVKERCKPFLYVKAQDCEGWEVRKHKAESTHEKLVAAQMKEIMLRMRAKYFETSTPVETKTQAVRFRILEALELRAMP
jgi:hypothetical protein